MGWFLELVLSAPCSQRAAASVVSWLSRLWPPCQAEPCANAGRTWLFRLGLYQLSCPKEVADDWVWLFDHTVQLESLIGKYKHLQAQHRGHGMNRTFLAVGALVGQHCVNTLRAALEQVTNRDVQN